MYQVTFAGKNGVRHSVEIEDDSDESIEQALRIVEDSVGDLPRDGGGFPSFTLYRVEDGDLIEIGGG